MSGFTQRSNASAAYTPSEVDRDERVSLAPLDPEDVLRALLATPPPDDQSDR